MSEDTPQEEVKGLSDEDRRALSVQVHAVFADPAALIRVDMSEYMEKFSVSPDRRAARLRWL